MQVPALAFVKLSIVFFYRRIFNTGSTSWHHWVTFSTAAATAAWGVSYFFAFLFICGATPQNYWVSAVNEKSYCVATQKLHLSFSISDMILDCIIILLALPMVGAPPALRLATLLTVIDLESSNVNRPQAGCHRRLRARCDVPHSTPRGQLSLTSCL